MPELAVNGTTLYYEDTGPGSTGQTIAFSHGLLWGTELFAPQIAALRDRYRCVAWDHRGQGKSASDHRHTIDMELVWADAVALLEKLVAEPVHFCGLSMGGFVAMRLGARRPDLVRSLLLLETSADPEPTEHLARYRLMVAAQRWLGPWSVKRRVPEIMLGKTMRSDPARRDEVERYAELMVRRRDAWRATNGVIDRGGIYHELGRIACPTLVLVGEEDVATPPAKAERIAAAIPNARLVRIPGAGHSSTIEQPASVTAALEGFLSAV